MRPDALPALFPEAHGVTISAGTTTRSGVDLLTPLAPEETPGGFDSWAEKRKREFRSGRHHARRALSSAGAPTEALRRDEEGVPIFPEGFCGSITHTGKQSTFAAVAVARLPLRIGIDAEELRELPEDMMAHILSDRERGMLSEVPQSHTPHLAHDGLRALLAFSAKEAFYKCIFPTLRCRLDFHDVEFRLLQSPGVDGQPGEFEVSLLKEGVELPEGALGGRFVNDEAHVVCGVCWEAAHSATG